MKHAYAYLHGFLSGPSSSKGVTLEAAFRRRGVTLHRLDLNGLAGPSGLTHEGAFDAVDRCWNSAGRGATLRLVGSSFGGWIASAYAARHPERVDRLLLLAPAFELGERWEAIVGGPRALAAWRDEGTRVFALPASGDPVSIPYAFAHETMSREPTPPVDAATWIVHGRDDAEVPLASSLRFASGRGASHTRLTILDDDHALTARASLDAVVHAAAEHFELCGPAEPPLPPPAAPAAPPAAPLAAPRVWEAERKLSLSINQPSGAGCEAALEAALRSLADCRPMGEERFVDEHWDTRDALLARHGARVRRRAGVWEAKLQCGDGSEMHEELRGASAVGAWLSAHLPGAAGPPAAGGGSERGVADTLRACGAAPFACFGSTRRKFAWRGLHLDLDVAWVPPRDAPPLGARAAPERPPAEPAPFHAVLKAEVLSPESAADAAALLEAELSALRLTLRGVAGGKAALLGAVSTAEAEGKLEAYARLHLHGGAHDELFTAWREQQRQQAASLRSGEDETWLRSLCDVSAMK